jgi:hypothetical protein
MSIIVIDIVKHNGKLYTPFKQLITTIGMEYRSQYKKLMNRTDKWKPIVIRRKIRCNNQNFTCIPIDKVESYINNINSTKVREDIKPILEKIQKAFLPDQIYKVSNKIKCKKQYEIEVL